MKFLAQQVCDLPPCPYSFWHFLTVSSFTPKLHSYATLITLAISVSSSYIPLLEQSIFPFEFSIFFVVLFGLSSLCTWFVCQIPFQTRYASFPPLTGPDTQLCSTSDWTKFHSVKKPKNKITCQVTHATPESFYMQVFIHAGHPSLF